MENHLFFIRDLNESPFTSPPAKDPHFSFPLSILEPDIYKCYSFIINEISIPRSTHAET